MRHQAATLNSFRLILIDAQSQGLSLHPLDQQFWLGNVAICSFISLLFFPHPYISLSPLKVSPDYSFYSQLSTFLLEILKSLGLPVS